MLLCALGLLADPGAAAADFAAGDIYLLSTDVPGLSTAIMRIDPVSGAASTLIDLPESPSVAATLAHDPFRDRLLYTDLAVSGGLRAVDSAGSVTTIASGLATPERIASRGDGILYLWYTPSSPLRYLDASDVAHDVLNQAGTGPQVFPLGASVQVMLYHATTHSLILIAGFGFAPCAAANDTCAVKVPLTPDGTQVAGPLEFAQVSVSTSSETPLGIGYGPSDTLFVVVDTNDNGEEPRMQLLAPGPMAFSPFASSGPFTGATVISTGTYSGVAGVGLIFDTFSNLVRAYTSGETGAGATFTTGLSGSGGHSEAARMVEIQPGPGAAVPLLPGGWLLALGLAAAGVLGRRAASRAPPP